MLVAATFFDTANYLEAALWGVIALVFAAYAARRRGRARRRCAVAAVTFLLFGLSDVVEVEKGAWWRPWWLLAWKGICVLSMILLLVAHALSKRRNR